MNQIAFSPAFEKSHAALAARMRGVAGSLFPARLVLLADAGEPVSGAGAVIRVRRATGDGAAGAAALPGTYQYRDPACELALAGLLARIALASGAGAPVAADPLSLSLHALADRLARTEVPVLLTGATGTGKEVLSRFVHARSARNDKAFVAVNCAAIPETMLEAVLFGHQKGAFTGAGASATGLMREADGGTLLLDEIAEMPLALQAKLLRALQEGEVLPVGATRPVKVDVRIIAAANRDLPAEVAAGRFREDLFYRLNVFPLHLPALRERPADIAPLACLLLLRHGSGAAALTPEALALLRAHVWPGNVRELENVMRRALVLAGEGAGAIGAEHIVFDTAARLHQGGEPPVSLPAAPAPLARAVRQSEARVIGDTLRACGGRRIEAARRLGISERTLRYRLAAFREAGMELAGLELGAAV